MLQVKVYSFLYPEFLYEFISKIIDGYKMESTGYDREGKYYILLSRMEERNRDEVFAQLKFWRHRRGEFYDYEL